MKGYQKILTCTLLLPLLAGCVDDKYDLSDIDTTVKVNVDHLTIPVNIDEITLGNIIKPNENQVEIIDGKYAIVYDGNFTSQGIKIDAIDLKAPTIAPSETTVNILPATQRQQGTEFMYPLTSQKSDFQFTSTSHISDFILGIDRIGANIQLDINISMRGLENKISRMTFKDIILQLPKGLNLTSDEGGSYNPINGELTLPSTITSSGTTMTLTIIADALDFQQAGGSLDNNLRNLYVPGSLYIKSGYGIISSNDIIAGATLPQQITLSTTYTLYDTQITSFSGTINRYDINGANLSDIDLTELPDILTQKATDITLANPMIYLQIDNPLQPYGNIYAETALKIETKRDDTPAAAPYVSDLFHIGKPAVSNGIYNLCLSPATPLADNEFPDARHVTFASLGAILSGNGIPNSLAISLDNPNLPANQTVSDFPLTGPDNAMGSFNGKYKFVAPLQFAQGSTISYNDKIDGWYSDDMQHLTVTDLEITLTASTDIPVGVEFEGHPINNAGQQINNVEIIGATLQPNADHQKITLRITGEITALDGVSFIAKAHAAPGGETLTPDMHIILSDIRPVVSGYFQKEL